MKLTEALVGKLQFQKVKDAEVAWIDAKLRARNKKILPKTTPLDGSQSTNGIATNGNTTSMEIDDDEEVTTNGEVADSKGTVTNHQGDVMKIENDKKKIIFFLFSRRSTKSICIGASC